MKRQGRYVIYKDSQISFFNQKDTRIILVEYHVINQIENSLSM